MALKMSAAVIERFGKPLTLREWDIPSAGGRGKFWSKPRPAAYATQISTLPAATGR